MTGLNIGGLTARRLLSALGCIALGQGPSPVALAQSLDTGYLQPAPDGANVIETIGSYRHFDAFQFSNGHKEPNTVLDVYTATVRYAHYFYIDGHPAGLQVFQPVSYVSNWHFNGDSNNNLPGVRSLQAGNTTLSVFFWPYSNVSSQTFIYTAAYLSPPDGSYSRGNAYNAGSSGWLGDAQIGVKKGFGPNFSVEAAGDVAFLSSESLGGGDQRDTDPIFRIQLWANWDWGSGLRTSLGYTGTVGGATTISSTGFQFRSARNAEAQMIRVAVSYWWNPRLRTSIELDRDVEANGGYKLGVGAVGRVKFLF